MNASRYTFVGLLGASNKITSFTSRMQIKKSVGVCTYNSFWSIFLKYYRWRIVDSILGKGFKILLDKVTTEFFNVPKYPSTSKYSNFKLIFFRYIELWIINILTFLSSYIRSYVLIILARAKYHTIFFYNKMLSIKNKITTFFWEE